MASITNTKCEWKYIEHFNNIWRIPNDWNEQIIFTENGINFEAIPNYLSISLIKNDEEENNDDFDENENDSVS
jgi:hypothetical protein